MRRKAALLALVLTLAMVIGSFQSVFAAGTPTKVTKKAIKDAEYKSVPTITDEVTAEVFAIDLVVEVAAGKYKLVDTAVLKGWVDKKSAVVIDTMPEGWFAARHIPGAVHATAGGETREPEFLMTKSEKAKLLKVAKDKCKVTKYYNTKTKKWQTGKIKGAKTRTVVNYKKKVVLYSGFIKCPRSHEAALYLRKKGFKNVHRYAGGISAWVDANYKIEGTDVD